MDVKATTWMELRDLLNATSEEHLNKPLSWMGDEDGGQGEVYVLSESLHRTGEGLEFKSNFDDDDELGEMVFPEGSLIFGHS